MAKIYGVPLPKGVNPMEDMHRIEDAFRILASRNNTLCSRLGDAVNYLSSKQEQEVQAFNTEITNTELEEQPIFLSRFEEA